MRLATILLLLLYSGLGWGAPPSGTAREKAYVAAEHGNDYQAGDSTVSEAFQNGKSFRVKYIEMPADRLNVESMRELSESQKAHVFLEKGGRPFVRFFIHPDSEHLYQPLIKEFGVAGEYKVDATSSTRTLLARDPKRPQLGALHLKTSLAQKQDAMGRVVPGWEVRRSVRVAEAWALGANRSTPNVEVIPEFAGVYVKKSEGLGFHVDKDQGEVFEHGMIFRDASFVNKEEKVVPLFWFFSHNGKKEPPIISMWKKSGEPKFEKFLAKSFFEPFIGMNLPFMLKEGIVPQIHGQNVVVSIDPRTLEIKKIFHRDVGSMKVDYRLRWISGLPMGRLQSELADKDFGLSWGAEKITEYHIDYLHDWIVRWGYQSGIRRHVPRFSLQDSERYFDEALDRQMTKATGVATGTAAEKVKRYISNNTPDFVALKPIDAPDGKIAGFVAEREGLEQSVKLPRAWHNKIAELHGPDAILYSEYGLVYAGAPDRAYRIAFFESPESKQRWFSKARARLLGLPGGGCAKGFSKLAPLPVDRSR